MKRAFLVAVALAFAFHFGNTRVGAQAPTPLSFFQNYFVTGDYAVGGVGLFNTGGVGSITVAGVPSGADISAAFLYWQVVTGTRTHRSPAASAPRSRGTPSVRPACPSRSNWAQARSRVS